MDQFARTVLGYHSCTEEFARDLLLGKKAISEWELSENRWDWLGHGIYFWEHSPERALRWAREQHEPKGEKAAIIGAVVQLGKSFDLLNEGITAILADSYKELRRVFRQRKEPIPKNTGKDWKLRMRDCLVINDCLEKLAEGGTAYDTVRGAFTEGEPVYPGAGFSREAHIQIAVRNRDCILGIFRPNLLS